MKVAVAVGNARRFVVGDPRSSCIDALAGRVIDGSPPPSSTPRGGEVVSTSGLDALGDRVESASGGATTRGRTLRRRRRGSHGDRRARAGSQPRPLPEESSGRGCCRPSMSGSGPATASSSPSCGRRSRCSCASGASTSRATTPRPRKLDAFVRRAQAIVTRYGGNVLQLTIGDKGATSTASSARRSPTRTTRREPRPRASTWGRSRRDGRADVRIGITHGRLRSGTYGHDLRRTYCCLGDAVNLAARLMAAAPPGRSGRGAVRQAAGDEFEWERCRRWRSRARPRR